MCVQVQCSTGRYPANVKDCKRQLELEGIGQSERTVSCSLLLFMSVPRAVFMPFSVSSPVSHSLFLSNCFFLLSVSRFYFTYISLSLGISKLSFSLTVRLSFPIHACLSLCLQLSLSLSLSACTGYSSRGEEKTVETSYDYYENASPVSKCQRGEEWRAAGVGMACRAYSPAHSPPPGSERERGKERERECSGFC